MYKQEGGPCCLKQGWLQRLRPHGLHAPTSPRRAPGLLRAGRDGGLPHPGLGTLSGPHPEPSLPPSPCTEGQSQGSPSCQLRLRPSGVVSGAPAHAPPPLCLPGCPSPSSREACLGPAMGTATASQ